MFPKQISRYVTYPGELFFQGDRYSSSHQQTHLSMSSCLSLNKYFCFSETFEDVLRTNIFIHRPNSITQFLYLARSFLSVMEENYPSEDSYLRTTFEKMSILMIDKLI